MTVQQAEAVTAGVEKRDENALDEIRLITQMIREHQKNIERLGVKRKSTILKLRKHRITYREIAEAMGTTEQNVYKIIREDIPRDPETGLARRGRPRKDASL
jgi:DNA-directed RNA polymerase specialized sigma24 family protein